jgi:hypothetical protein
MNEVLRAMLMTKLKTYVAVGLMAVVIGLGGLAYRASGQGPRAGDRPPSDLDLLRKEVEILKLQVEVLQHKVRGQEAELRALRNQAAPRVPGGRQGAGTTAKPNSPAWEFSAEWKPFQESWPSDWVPRDEVLGYYQVGERAVAAAKALRDATNPAAARAALEELDRAVRGVREPLRAAPPARDPNRPGPPVKSPAQ